MKSYLGMEEEIVNLEFLGDKDAGDEEIHTSTRKIASLLQSHSTSLVRQLLEAVPKKEYGREKHGVAVDSFEGWNSCRSQLIAKAIQLGVVEKEGI